MPGSHEELDIPLPDGALRVLRWGTGGRAAVAVHGITASAMSWQPVTRALPSDWSLCALDMRGRGRSAALPGPYGLDRHVQDIRAVTRHLGLDRPVLAGHSLGVPRAACGGQRGARAVQPADLCPVLHRNHLLPPWLGSSQAFGKKGQNSVATPGSSIHLPSTPTAGKSWREVPASGPRCAGWRALPG
jgi:pimeloyl-ACP methyl ester carboxylesterase